MSYSEQRPFLKLSSLNFWLAAILTGLLISLCPAAESLILKAEITPKEAWRGQRVNLKLEVLSSEGWSKISKFNQVEIPGAYLIRKNITGTRIQRTIDGTSYTGQQYDLSVYPQIDGEITIPPFPAVAEIKELSYNGKITQKDINFPACSFISKSPPGAEKIGDLISTNRLTAEQSWSTENTQFNVGDALTRSVTLVAEDVSAMAFAPISHPKFEGVGLYPANPILSDESTRGSLVGMRTESITYILEQPGQLDLPAGSYTWWDLKNQSLQTIELPGRTVSVSGTALNASAVEPVAKPTATKYWLLFSIVLFAIFAASSYWRKQIELCFLNWRKRVDNREKSQFKKFRQAVQSGSTSEALTNLMRWLEHPSTSHPARLDEFLKQYANKQEQDSARQLVKGLVNGQQSDLNPFREIIIAARKKWLLSLKLQNKQQRAHYQLPQLNR